MEHSWLHPFHRNRRVDDRLTVRTIAHPAPERAISDGAQSLDLTQFAKMMDDLRPYISLWQNSRQQESATVAAATR